MESNYYKRKSTDLLNGTDEINYNNDMDTKKKDELIVFNSEDSIKTDWKTLVLISSSTVLIILMVFYVYK